MKQPTLQRLEAGHRQDPGFSIVARLASALGVSLDILADGIAGYAAGSAPEIEAQHGATLHERVLAIERILSNADLKMGHRNGAAEA